MRQLLQLIISILLLTAGVLGSHAHASLGTNIDVEEFTLDNGMLFLVVNRPAMPQVAVRLAIRPGSALEETGKTGIAHLLEHIMSKAHRISARWTVPRMRNSRKKSKPPTRWF